VRPPSRYVTILAWSNAIRDLLAARRRTPSSQNEMICTHSGQTAVETPER